MKTLARIGITALIALVAFALPLGFAPQAGAEVHVGVGVNLGDPGYYHHHHRDWVPGYWIYRHHHYREWVPGHWEYR